MKTFALLIMLAISALVFSNPPESIAQILNSGDGKSCNTAFKVSSIEEEYQVLKYLKLNPRMQMLILFEGQYYDALMVGESVVYFKISITRNK